MQYQSYDDYMRNLIGCSNTYMNDNIYENGYTIGMGNQYANGLCGECDCMKNYVYNSLNNSSRMYQNVKLDDLFPEVYTIILPMVRKAIRDFQGEFNKDSVNIIANDICNNIESANVVILNRSCEEDKNKKMNNIEKYERNDKLERVNMHNSNLNSSINSKLENSRCEENKVDNSRIKTVNNLLPNNYLLKDLIKIILIYELINNKRSASVRNSQQLGMSPASYNNMMQDSIYNYSGNYQGNPNLPFMMQSRPYPYNEF